MPSKPGLNPHLPKEGDEIVIFGIKGTVIEVVPHTPWDWSITAQCVNGGGSADERMIIQIPTDYSTTSGEYAWLEDEDTAWDRDEHDPCERGTQGCSVRHRDMSDSPCQTW